MKAIIPLQLSNSPIGAVYRQVRHNPTTKAHANMKPSFQQKTIAYLLAVSLCLTMATARADTFYVSNYGNNTISKITSNGVVSTFATVPMKPYGLVCDSRGYLYVASSQFTNKISWIGTNGSVNTLINLPRAYDATDMAFDKHGYLYVASQGGYGIGRFRPFGSSIGPFSTKFTLAFGLAFDRDGNLFVADALNGRISKVTTDGTVSTFATGMVNAWGLAFDARGYLYVANSTKVSKIMPDGVVSTFATGFGWASGLAFGTGGDLYVVDQGKNAVSRVAPDGTVSEFATGLSQPSFIAVQPDLSPPTLTMPPQLPEEIKQNGATFAVNGGINLRYQILYSEDLVTWTPFQTNQITASSRMQIVDPDAANSPQRFYRAHLLP